MQMLSDPAIVLPRAGWAYVHFDSKALRPLTLGTAKCLLPGPDLAPMLAGQLEWLASQGVQETIILCVWRADEVAGHVRAMLTRRVLLVENWTVAAHSLGPPMSELL